MQTETAHQAEIIDPVNLRSFAEIIPPPRFIKIEIIECIEIIKHAVVAIDEKGDDNPQLSHMQPVLAWILACNRGSVDEL